MAVSVFTRFVNIRNVMNVNNFSAVGTAINVVQCSSILSKPYSTDNDGVVSANGVIESGQKINKVMKVYLQQALDYKQFIEKQVAEYDIGKRHLANIMGEDPDNFSDKDINRAIEYLFPSGLYDREARPMMVHPNKLFEHRKEAEFDETGRPHHFLFYTTKPNYYLVLHKIAASMNYLNKMEDKRIEIMNLPTPEDKADLQASEWLKKFDLEAKLFEELSDAEYEYFITSMQRVIEHPLSKHVSSFLMDYRKKLEIITNKLNLPQLQYDDDKRPYILLQNCKRKSARGDVKILGNGTGNITINGEDISYFQDKQCREQVIFPLIFTNMSDKVDIEATVSGGGPTGQSGLIRWGVAMGLRNFVSVEMIEKMRVAGLLTHDLRCRERKKFGQEGARRKFTWKKR